MALSDERRMFIVKDHRDSCYHAIGSIEYDAELQEKLVAAEELEHMSTKDKTRLEKNQLELARQQQVQANRERKRKEEIWRVRGEMTLLKAQLEILQAKLDLLIDNG